MPALRQRPDGNWARAFLACPVERVPGTHFLYNTGATYMGHVTILLRRLILDGSSRSTIPGQQSLVRMNTMPIQIHACQCPDCLGSTDHPTWQLHHQMNLFLSRLNEQQRRWFVALEAKKIGHGGDRLLAQITGMDVETIRRGRRELDEELATRPVDRVRQAGGGRPPAEKKIPRSRVR
jgi:hypothetical protein